VKRLDKVVHSTIAVVHSPYLHRRCTVHGNGQSSGSAYTMAKILIVEDNEMNLDMLSRRLKRKGHDIVSAMDGGKGVEMSQTENPDIILMDMGLPVIDGWEATRRIKAEPKTANIPVIALTAHAIAGDREKCIAAGCDDYDTKPIELPRLLSKINGLLGIC
jgi:two-component system, cell cycle response regulator DivK